MFALNYMAKATSPTMMMGTNETVAGTGQTPRTRSNSVASTSVQSEGGKMKTPHTEGQIKWITTIDCGAELMCTKFSRTGAIFGCGLANGHIKIFQADHGTLLHSLADEDIIKSHLPCTSLHFVPFQAQDKEERQHVLMATYASGMVKFWHYTSGRCIHTIDEARQTLCSAFNYTGEKFVTGGADPQMNIYDSETRKRIITLEPSDGRDVMNGHRLRVFSLQYHPLDAHLLISGGWDDTVQFWDDRQAHSVRRIYGPHICGDALDIDAVHNHILTGSWRKNNVLQIWDVGSGAKIKDVPQDALHKCMLYCCQWLGRDYIICGGNEQNMARIIDRGTLNTVAQLVDLDQGVYCIDNDKTSNLPRIAIGAAQNLYLMKQEKRT